MEKCILILYLLTKCWFKSFDLFIASTWKIMPLDEIASSLYYYRLELLFKKTLICTSPKNKYSSVYFTRHNEFWYYTSFFCHQTHDTITLMSSISSTIFMQDFPSFYVGRYGEQIKLNQFFVGFYKDRLRNDERENNLLQSILISVFIIMITIKQKVKRLWFTSIGWNKLK